MFSKVCIYLSKVVFDQKVKILNYKLYERKVKLLPVSDIQNLLLDEIGELRLKLTNQKLNSQNWVSFHGIIKGIFQQKIIWYTLF